MSGLVMLTLTDDELDSLARWGRLADTVYTLTDAERDLLHRVADYVERVACIDSVGCATAQ